MHQHAMQHRGFLSFGHSEYRSILHGSQAKGPAFLQESYLPFRFRSGNEQIGMYVLLALQQIFQAFARALVKHSFYYALLAHLCHQHILIGTDV
ncbi:MAG: hypothetical protein RL160_647, partial [Bacteroidota bacterium]